MFRKALAACVLFLGLSGCDAWKADRALIEIMARDAIGMNGDYKSMENVLSIRPLAQNRYQMTIKPIGSEAGAGTTANVAFDLLRSDRSGNAEDGYSYYNYYLTETERQDSDGKTFFAYDIVRSYHADSVEGRQLSQFSVLCSQAARGFAGSSEGDCTFSNYSDLRAAAMDVLAWMDDARAKIETETFFPPSEDE